MGPEFLTRAVRQVHDQREEAVAPDRRVLATETAHRVWTFFHAVPKAANDPAHLPGPLGEQ